MGTDGLSGDSHSELSESSSDSDGERKRDRDSMSNGKLTVKRIEINWNFYWYDFIDWSMVM